MSETVMQEFFHIFRLRNDLTVFTRLFRPSDIKQIFIGFDKLSDRSRYRRFMNPVRKLPDRHVHDLLSVDNINNLAICAGVIGAEGWEGAGIARFVRSHGEPDTAEVALTVIDKYQGLGIGSLLFQSLVENAQERGIRNLSGSLLTDNASMIRILRHHPIQSTLEEGPIIRFIMPIDHIIQCGAVELPGPDIQTAPGFEGMF